jgi:hypothetical protein
MSRHTFAGHAGTTLAVGWDRPLGTFFVQVSRPHPTLKGESEIIAWHGTDDGELATAAAALEIAADYADLPGDLGATLETDRMKTLGQANGPVQIAAQRFRHNGSL